MDVSLYVYDLTKGMARQLSRQFLGIQIDAVYHTSIVLNNIEYWFGQGVQTLSPPGATHHGQPMEVIKLGQTSLPPDIILDYLDSLKQIYTPESYDLFAHNCNNFSHDFSIFLVGKGIPDHITSLPKRVLETPFGQMLKPQLDQAMRPITQAPVANGNTDPAASLRNRPPPSSVGSPKPQSNGATTVNGNPKNSQTGRVQYATSLSQLNSLLNGARDSCAVIFFTSSTCPPCKLVYPLYDELAAQHESKATLIKVDIGSARDAAAAYSIRATPTFISFLKGEKDQTWQGANPGALRANVDMLVKNAFPPHPHQLLNVRTFLRASVTPVIYRKVPPLEKLTAKLGSTASDPNVTATTNFVKLRNNEGAKEAPLPDLSSIGDFISGIHNILPSEVLFAAYDLFRLLFADPRVSGYYLAHEPTHPNQTNKSVLTTLLNHVNSQAHSCPYNLRLVSIHLACNLFSANAASRHIILHNTTLASSIVTLITDSLLDKDHANLRTAASSLAFNLTSAEHVARTSAASSLSSSPSSSTSSDDLPADLQTQLAASLIEFLSSQPAGAESPEATRGAALALARLAFLAPQGGEVLDLCGAMDAGAVVCGKAKAADGAQVDKGDVKLFEEIGKEILGKGVN